MFHDVDEVCTLLEKIAIYYDPLEERRRGINEGNRSLNERFLTSFHNLNFDSCIHFFTPLVFCSGLPKG
jgi:hypothetical protein